MFKEYLKYSNVSATCVYQNVMLYKLSFDIIHPLKRGTLTYIPSGFVLEQLNPHAAIPARAYLWGLSSLGHANGLPRSPYKKDK